MATFWGYSNEALFLVSACALAASTPALAQDKEPGSTISVAVTGGSLGIGPEIGYRFADHFGVRANATFLNIGANFDSDDLEYGGDLKLNSFGAMVDVYPFGGNFRISGGARINNNKVKVKLTPTGSTEFGGTEYTAAEIGSVSGSADVKDFSPALTLGWSGSNRRGFMIGAEAGVLFQGAARLREFRATGTLASDPVFRADLERERRSLQDDIDKVKVYPILQFTVGYRF